MVAYRHPTGNVDVGVVGVVVGHRWWSASSLAPAAGSILASLFARTGCSGSRGFGESARKGEEKRSLKTFSHYRAFADETPDAVTFSRNNNRHREPSNFAPR